MNRIQKHLSDHAKPYATGAGMAMFLLGVLGALALVAQVELRAVSAAQASLVERLEAIAQLIAGLDSPREQAALLDEFLSRAQSAAEMHALKQAVAKLTAAQKSA